MYVPDINTYEHESGRQPMFQPNRPGPFSFIYRRKWLENHRNVYAAEHSSELPPRRDNGPACRQHLNTTTTNTDSSPYLSTPTNCKSVDNDSLSAADYRGISPILLYCSACNFAAVKHPDSFVKHLKSEGHKSRLSQSTVMFESVKTFLRLRAQFAENGNGPDFLSHVGGVERSGKQFCMTCDCSFFESKGISHTETEHHQILANFLHPTCNVCTKGRTIFKSPVEYHEHCTTPEHLRSLQRLSSTESSREPNKNDWLLFFPSRRNKFVKPKQTAKSLKSSRLTTMAVKERKKWMTAKSYEDLKLPKSCGKAIGFNYVQSVSGNICTACSQSFKSDNDIWNHLKTRRHFDNVKAHLKNAFNKTGGWKLINIPMKQTPDQVQCTSSHVEPQSLTGVGIDQNDIIVLSSDDDDDGDNGDDGTAQRFDYVNHYDGGDLALNSTTTTSWHVPSASSHISTFLP